MKTTARTPASFEPHLEAWEISPAAFPASGSSFEKLEFCVNYAILAPSSHNTQPWHFHIGGSDLELHADPARGLPQFVPSETARFVVADLVAEGDRIQWSGKPFREELARWLRANHAPSRDGIPGYAQGLNDLLAYAGPLLVRTFDRGAGIAAKDRDIALYSPALAVLGTENDAPGDWLAAGQALAKVLLRARIEDVWASFLNQPIEVAALRPRLLEAVGREGYPQLLMRLGFAPEVRPTPRRALADVVTRKIETFKLPHY